MALAPVRRLTSEMRIGSVPHQPAIDHQPDAALRADPSLANSDPLGAGWFFKVKLANAGELDGLMDETAYTSFAASA